MKRLNIWLPLLLSFILVIGMLLGFKIQDGDAQTQSLSGKPGSIEELLRLIESKYVDETNREELVETAINNILKELDPHSSYIPAARLQAVNEELDGKFEGVGIQFTVLNDTIFVVTPISGGPADKLGVLTGDKIVMIEDSVVAGIEITTDGVIDKLKGKKGSKVKIGIQRGKNKKIIDYTITRDVIPLYSVDAAYMLNEATGYIKVNRFSGTTYREFMEKLEAMTNDGLQNLVIDLRGNPGGYLTAATKMLDQLFEERRLLVYTEGRTYARNNYKSTGRQLFPLDKVAVLIDEGSASASEILAGAVQDHDRGAIIGRRSFGKGLVQEQYDLSDGSALRLTVARYYTPSGRSIQKPYDDMDAYGEEAYNRFKNGELMNQDSVSVGDTTKFYTAEGRVVYGGGGIMPDVFIPIDTTLYSNDFYTTALQYIPQFVYSEYGELESELTKHETVQVLSNQFNVTDAMFNKFITYVKNEEGDLKINTTELAKAKSNVQQRIKAYFARQVFQDTGYFYIMNQDDKMIDAALKSME
ncbi:MAG: S41 family peptidase [Saprospiraceae bacterium]